jgi:ribosomal protein S18 acetylase RimI-like enzyme
MAITATTSLARRIDRAEFQLMAGCAEVCRAARETGAVVLPVGDVGAVYCEPGAPYNKLIGLGFGDVILDEQLAAVERDHAERGAPVQVELSTLADPSVAERLTRRGYRLVGFENVLGRALDGLEPGRPRTSGLTIGRVGERDRGEWISTMMEGFLHQDQFDGPPTHETFATAVLERAYSRFAAVPGAGQWLARLNGQPAGGASLFGADGIAMLCGAATRPAFRRQGVQTALLEDRLSHARQSGLDLAVVTTQPGSKSQENVQRLGFELLYSRAILVKN